MDVCKKYDEDILPNNTSVQKLNLKGIDHLPEVNSLEELIKQLNIVFESDSVNVDYVKYLMTVYKSNPAEWKKYAKFDRFR